MLSSTRVWQIGEAQDPDFKPGEENVQFGRVNHDF
jgi:hypothetical protein